MNQGLVRRIQCFKVNDGRSAYVTHSFYAHRSRPSLIIQEIDIINPSDQTLDLDFIQKPQVAKKDVKQLDQQEIEMKSSKVTFRMITYRISTRQHNAIIAVIITNALASSSHIKPDRYFSILTCFV